MTFTEFVKNDQRLKNYSEIYDQPYIPKNSCPLNSEDIQDSME